MRVYCQRLQKADDRLVGHPGEVQTQAAHEQQIRFRGLVDLLVGQLWQFDIQAAQQVARQPGNSPVQPIGASANLVRLHDPCRSDIDKLLGDEQFAIHFQHATGQNKLSAKNFAQTLLIGLSRCGQCLLANDPFDFGSLDQRQTIGV